MEKKTLSNPIFISFNDLIFIGIDENILYLFLDFTNDTRSLKYQQVYPTPTPQTGFNSKNTFLHPKLRK